jgi:poly(3-hydroxybutyrate) depolymerase
VTLSNPTGGAMLGTASTTVNILDASGLTSRKVAPPFDTALTIRGEGAVNLITWSGGGQLQRADRPMGPWQTLTTATNPFTVQSPLPTTFYRVTRPRPVNVYIPSSYDGKTPLPLVIMLHGYKSSAANFWNASDACCNFYNSGVDDAGYLRALIEEIGRQFSVDRKRIYLIGHSNGGYMTYRMACEYADLIAGIAVWPG